MKIFVRVIAILFCAQLMLSACTSVPVATAMAEAALEETQLQLPGESDILSVSTDGNSIGVIYENGGGYHAAVFGEDGTLIGELCQSAEVLSAYVLASGKLAVWQTDRAEVWDMATQTKESSFALAVNAVLDANGQFVWTPERDIKSYESNPLAVYVNIPTVTREAADGTQTVLEMPEGVSELIYADDPYLYYEKEDEQGRSRIFRMDVLTRESTEYAEWIRGVNLTMGHRSKLFQNEILVPWEQPDEMVVAHHAQILARDGETLLLQGGEGVFVIDAKKQSLLARIPVDGEIVAGCVNVENRCFVLADSSSARVYHWAGEGSETDMAEIIDASNVSSAIQARREALLSLYDITVTNDISMIGEYFQAEALQSDLRDYVACMELTDFFALLPQGMTDEMRPAAMQIFPVCLTGHMICAGLSFPYEDSYYLALDVSFLYDTFDFQGQAEVEDGSMMGTLSHEFLHMLEFRVGQTTLADGESILSLWDTVIPPEDESFTGSYEGNWEAQYSLDSEDPAEDIWFENAYSRTIPEEDRGTLMACLFSGVHLNGEGWDVYPHLLEKGQLLCAIIREAYPSVQACAPGSVYWERNFDQLPLSDFLSK